MFRLYSSNEAFAVVRIPNFRFFLGYRFFMTMATLMQSVIVGWHIYFLTKNVFWLGFTGLIEVIPQIAISLFAGHYVDVLNRKKIIMFTTSLLIVGSAILFIYSIPSLNMYHLLGIWPIFVTLFITGLSRGILMPAHTALMGQLIDKKYYANAATWSSVNWHIGAVVGPAVGGLVYAFGGIVSAYLSVFFIYLLSLVMAFLLKAENTAIPTASDEDIFSRIREGIAFVMKTPELVGAFSLDMFAVLFGGAVALLPVFASDVLHVGPQGLGLLRACPAIGAIFMSVFLMFYPPKRNAGRWLLIAVTGFGCSMIAFALSQTFWLSAALLLMSGLFDNISVVIRGTILQLYTPNEMRGRVASVNSIFVGSSNELGSFESGVAAKWMGLIPSVIFGGTMTLLIVASMAKFNPKLRNLFIQ